jgi:hypothetical protein
MPQRGAQIASIKVNQPCTPAMWQMAVKEFGDNSFVNAAGSKSLLTNPLCKMGNAAYAIAKRGRSIAMVSQVPLVSINVWRKRPSGKPIGTGRCPDDFHGVSPYEGPPLHSRAKTMSRTKTSYFSESLTNTASRASH